VINYIFLNAYTAQANMNLISL